MRFEIRFMRVCVCFKFVLCVRACVCVCVLDQKRKFKRMFFHLIRYALQNSQHTVIRCLHSKTKAILVFSFNLMIWIHIPYST